MQHDFSFVDRSGTGSVKWAFAPKAVKEAGVMPFTVADMEFRTAPEIIHAACTAAKHGVFGYTMADEAYLDAFKGYMEKIHGAKIETEWTVITPGVVSALFIAVRALTQPGDGVIIQPPVYPPFTGAVVKNGRELLLNPLVNNNGRYEMDYEGLEALAKQPNTKLMILCSPHNPVGRVWTSEELARVGRICRENGVAVVSDEIHADVTYNGHAHTLFFEAAPECRESCIVCTALSKTFNIAGLNCSNILIPGEEMRKVFIHQKEVDCVGEMNYFAYGASIAAFNSDSSWMNAMLAQTWKNFEILRDFFHENFPSAVVYEPEGTYLAWIDLNGWNLTEDELTAFLVEKALFAVNRGSTFGRQGSGFVRFNLASPEAEVRAGLERLKTAAQAAGLR